MYVWNGDDAGEEGPKRVGGILVNTHLKRFQFDSLTKIKYYILKNSDFQPQSSLSRSNLSHLRYEFGLHQNTKVVAPRVIYLPVKFRLNGATVCPL